MSTQQRHERIPVFTAGDRLRKAREAAGLGQGELAQITGISRGTVSHLELDKTPLKRSYLNLWSMATSAPVEWLESGDDQRPTPPPGGGQSPSLERLTSSKRSRTRATSLSGDTQRYVAAA